MEDIEILANLKKVYEMIFDLKENTDALSNDSKIMQELNDMYDKVYKRISIERKGPLSIQHDKKVLIISSSIEGDYEDKKGITITCGDINFCWYHNKDKCVFIDQKTKIVDERSR